MKIEITVQEHLNSFELSQLEKFLETLEFHLLYSSGLDKWMGGYAIAEAFDIIEGEEYDEATDTWTDIIEVETEVGETDGETTHCTKSCHKIARNTLTDKNLDMRGMLEKLQEA